MRYYIDMTYFYVPAWHVCLGAASRQSWWRHPMETISALLAICADNSPVIGDFPTQRQVTRSFEVFVDLRLNKGWVNTGEAGDLRRHRVHYDVTLMAKNTNILKCEIVAFLYINYMLAMFCTSLTECDCLSCVLYSIIDFFNWIKLNWMFYQSERTMTAHIQIVLGMWNIEDLSH